MALHQSSHTKGLCLHLAQSRSQPSRPFVRPVLRLLTRACGDCERAGRTRSTGLLAAPPHSAPASQRLARSSSRRSSAGGGPAPERQAELLPSAAAVSGDAKSSAGLGRRAEALDQLSCSGRQHSGQLLDGAVGGARGADPASEAGGHAESLSAAPAAHEPHACSGSGRGVTGGGGQSLDGAVEEVRGRSAAASKAGDFSGSLGVRAALAALYIYKGVISPLLPKSCRFLPTCSEYSMRAYREYGTARGTALTVWRVLRCNPLSEGGFDPPRWPPPGLDWLFGCGPGRL